MCWDNAMFTFCGILSWTTNLAVLLVWMCIVELALTTQENGMVLYVVVHMFLFLELMVGGMCVIHFLVKIVFWLVKCEVDHYLSRMRCLNQSQMPGSELDWRISLGTVFNFSIINRRVIIHSLYHFISW